MKLPNSRIVIDDRERKSGIPELIKKIGEIQKKYPNPCP